MYTRKRLNFYMCVFLGISGEKVQMESGNSLMKLKLEVAASYTVDHTVQKKAVTNTSCMMAVSLFGIIFTILHLCLTLTNS